MASKHEATSIDVDNSDSHQWSGAASADDAAPPRHTTTTKHLIASPSKKSRVVSDVDSLEEEGGASQQHDEAYAVAAGDDEDAEMFEGGAVPTIPQKLLKRNLNRVPYSGQQQQQLGQYAHEKRRVDDKLLDEFVRQRYLKEIGDIFAEPAAPAAP